ncbi:MAG: BREX-1 system adenine-specific DNA-methyltransferase PglX [Muribaculum sp.]|nr:BREX-1 system adenine-specific DNA-methyltransferase PglX [Muribaculum sp.]
MHFDPERKELDSINKQIDECMKYHNRLHTMDYPQQAIDLDDSVVVNYAKCGSVVSKL